VRLKEVVRVNLWWHTQYIHCRQNLYLTHSILTESLPKKFYSPRKCYYARIIKSRRMRWAGHVARRSE
jgi:hypothetical protein